jgi:hypothetical protein
MKTDASNRSGRNPEADEEESDVKLMSSQLAREPG